VKIERVDHGLDDFLLVESGEPRAAGLHVSELYGALHRRLDPKRYKGDIANPLYLAIGLAWEQYFERVLLAAGLNATRPPAFTTPDGIHFSPDLLIFNGINRIGEMKYTTMSVSDTLSEDKFGKYKTQLRVYAHHLGIYHARLYIYFAVGDWKRNVEPQLRAFDISMTPDECADEWTACVNNGRAEGLL
jgi:hypothetical protein